MSAKLDGWAWDESDGKRLDRLRNGPTDGCTGSLEMRPKGSRQGRAAKLDYHWPPHDFADGERSLERIFGEIPHDLEAGLSDLELVGRCRVLLKNPDWLAATLAGPAFLRFYVTVLLRFTEVARPKRPTQRELARYVDTLMDDYGMELAEARAEVEKIFHRKGAVASAHQRYGHNVKKGATKPRRR